MMPSFEPVRCDGCAQPASPEHIARRLRRLELATRYRPIHIGVLFLADSPPLRVEDYFYFANEDSAGSAVGHPAEAETEPAGAPRALFDFLLEVGGVSLGVGKGDAARLAEFQKRGFFLADALECPVEEIAPGLRDKALRGCDSEWAELLERFGPTVVKRIQFSYKPRHIALLSAHTRHLIPILERAGLADRLLLYQGGPLDWPRTHDAVAQAEFRTRLAEVLASATPGDRSRAAAPGESA